MACPRCNSTNINRRGKYNAKLKIGIKYRWKCKDCNYHFIIRTESYRKKIPMFVKEKIRKLWRMKKPYINRLSPTKKLTYTTRDIASMLNVSHDFVWKTIKKKG